MRRGRILDACRDRAHPSSGLSPREVTREDDRQGQERRDPGPRPRVRGAQAQADRAAPRRSDRRHRGALERAAPQRRRRPHRRGHPGHRRAARCAAARPARATRRRSTTSSTRSSARRSTTRRSRACGPGPRRRSRSSAGSPTAPTGRRASAGSSRSSASRSSRCSRRTPSRAMEELGHTFFVFVNAETERVAILYRRDDGDYGLIEPVVGGDYTKGRSHTLERRGARRIRSAVVPVRARDVRPRARYRRRVVPCRGCFPTADASAPTCRWAAAWSRPSSGPARSAPARSRSSPTTRRPGAAAPSRPPSCPPSARGWPSSTSRRWRSTRRTSSTSPARTRTSSPGRSTLLASELRAAPGVRGAVRQRPRRLAPRIGRRGRDGTPGRRARARAGRDRRAARTRPMLVLENSPGSGFGLGTNVAELADIAEAVGGARRPARLGSGSASTPPTPGRPGSTSSDPAAIDAFLADFDARIGLDRLVMIHLNDSKSERGSLLDRHEHLGAGRIGVDGPAASPPPPGARARHLLPRDARDGRGLRRGQHRPCLRHRRRPARWPTCRRRRWTCRGGRARSGPPTGRRGRRRRDAGIVAPTRRSCRRRPARAAGARRAAAPARTSPPAAPGTPTRATTCSSCGRSSATGSCRSSARRPRSATSTTGRSTTTCWRPRRS